MGKKAACLVVIVALAVSVLGCAQKPMELTPQQRTNLTEVAKFGVYNKVYTTYGLEPGITVEDITAHDVSINDYYKLEFTAKGTYAVKADNDEYYTGTFTVTGYWEAHGAGTDKCDITAPKNGSKTLPEKNIVQETEAAADTTTATEPTESTIYQPLAEYINANTSSMGRIIEKVFESDVNQDGSPDLCVTVVYGSGIVSSAVVVYDVKNDKGYILDERMSYDYTILGASEYVVAVVRTSYGKDAKKYGTLAIEGDALVFVENEEVGATLPTRNG